MTRTPLEIVYRKTADLIPDPKNARTHSAEQVEQLRASYREFGFTNPILLRSSGMIGAGHGRWMMAQAEALEEVPTITLAGLTEAQWRAYALADNKLAMNAGWDEELLRSELAAIGEETPDLLAGMGFSADELDEMLDGHGQASRDPDALPAVPAVAVTIAGDIWRLGAHRAMCGDSTSPQQVTALMGDLLADLMFTSPPYGQQRDYGVAKEQTRQWDRLMNGVFAALPVHDQAQLLVNLGLVHKEAEWIPYWADWMEWMRAQGWRRFGFYIWDQGPGLPGKWHGRLAPAFEFIFHFNREAILANKTAKAKGAGEARRGGGLRAVNGVIPRKTMGGNVAALKTPDSVFRVMRHKGGLGDAGKHPAVFPVALVEEVFAAFSRPGALTFEPFLGSGTQIIAAEKTGRVCRGMDIDPIYVDVAVRRWETYTGREARLETTGQTFQEVAAQRIEGTRTDREKAGVS